MTVKSASQSMQYPRGNFCNGSHIFQRAKPRRFAGHTINDAGVLILPDRPSARLHHTQQADSAIFAHTGKKHAYRALPNLLRRGLKQDIYRRTVVIDGV